MNQIKNEKSLLQRSTRGKLHLGRLFLCIVMLFFICSATLLGVHTYNTPDIYGKWQSEETKKIIEFKQDGTVILKTANEVGEFELLTPNKLSYTIQDKLFIMYYILEGRTLKWGFSKENVEVFKRK